MTQRRRATPATDPFAVLGLKPSAGLSDEERPHPAAPALVNRRPYLANPDRQARPRPARQLADAPPEGRQRSLLTEGPASWPPTRQPRGGRGSARLLRRP